VARDETSSSSNDEYEDDCDDDESEDDCDDDDIHDDHDGHDPNTKKAWRNLLKKLEKYFDDKKPLTRCGQYFKRQRRRKFFEQPDTNLLCAIHHAVLHNNLYVVKTLVDKYGCGKNANLVCCRSLSQSHCVGLVSRDESTE
jgi:hypothetical protein